MNNTSKPPQPHHHYYRARRRARRLTTARPVPLTVWTGHATKPRGRPGVAPAPAAASCSRHLPPWLASRIVTEFSQPGDVIVAPDSGDAALLMAAARHERQAIGYTLTRSDAQRIRHTLAAELRPPQRLLVHIREGWPPARPAARGHATQARLLIGLTPCQARHPGCAGPDILTARVTSLCHAASQLLAHDGTLVVVTKVGPPVMTASDPAASAARAAESVGFPLRQLVAAVHFTPAPPRTRATRSHSTTAGGTEHGTPRGLHSTQFDLLVLGKPRRPSSRSGRRRPW
jgi:hypothetical protein